MFALRHLARNAPRSIARLTSKPFSQPSLLRSVPAATTAWAVSSPRLTAAFHQSAARRDTNSGVNDELLAKLQSEISVETDVNHEDDLSVNIKEYLDNSPYEIQDKPGYHEVILTRTYNDEKIRIIFSTADVNANSPNEELGEDNAMYDDPDMETQSGGASTKGSVSQGKTQDGNVRVAPDDGVSPADREELEDDFEDDGQPQGYPARVQIRIERPGKGALAFEATAQDGDIMVEDLYFFPSADLAGPDTAEQEWARRALYAGPPFGNLDEDLQILVEKYLDERGINTRLAMFIPDYIDHKEQKEYIAWLNNVKNFVE